MKRVWSVLLIGFFFSCTDRSDPAVSIDEDGCIVLNLDEAMRHESDLKWSDMVTSIEYVPLETSDSCLLKAVIPLDMTDDYILVDDFGNAPALFDRQGKFLRRIGRKGRGPGEIQRAVLYGHIDPKTNEITLFLYGLYAMRFDIQGKFLGEDRLPPKNFYPKGEPYRSPYLPEYYHMGNGDRTFYFHFNPDSTRVFTSATFDREASFERIPGMFGVRYMAEPRKNYLNYNNIHYRTQYRPCFFKADDYIGYFDGQKNHGRYYRFYYDGRIENPYRFVYEDNVLEDGFDIREFSEIGNYICIYAYLRKKWELFWYDTKARRLHYIHKPEGITNDLDGDYPLCLSYITPNGKQLYGLLDIGIRKEVSDLPNTRLHNLLDSLPEDANGLLVYATLR